MAARQRPSVRLYSTAVVSSAIPDSAPNVATRSSPACESAPACSDESATVVDLSLRTKVPKSAESAAPQAISPAVWRLAYRASAADHHWHESSPRRLPTTHAPNGSATP